MEEAFDLLFIRGRGGQANLSLLINGYGYGSARMAVNELTKGTLVTYSIEDDNMAIDFSVPSASYSVCRYTIVAFYGGLPTLSVID